MQITFTPLSEQYFPLLLKWFRMPHIKAWGGSDINWTEELIQQAYSNYAKGYKLEDGKQTKIDAFIICLEEKPIGYIQVYDAYDFQTNLPTDLPQSLASFHILIGEPDYLSKGIGSKALKLFFKDFYKHNYEYIFASLDPKNINAIETYKKADFITAKEFSTPTEIWMFKSTFNKESIKKFFDSYKQAYEHKNAEQVVSHCEFPCFLRANDQSLFFEKDNFQDNIENLIQAWSLRGFKKVDCNILEINYFTSKK